jgi:hypothetical protein
VWLDAAHKCSKSFIIAFECCLEHCRSKPVAEIKAVITTHPQFVNYPDSQQFAVSVCFHYFGRKLPSHLEIAYSLSMEESRVHAGLLPRVTLAGTKETVMNATVMATVDVLSCENFTLGLHDNIQDKINPIIVGVTYWLPSENPELSQDGNPDISKGLMPVLRLHPGHTSSQVLLKFVISFT